MIHMGLDIGGTKTETLVLDGQGTELYRQRAATQKDGYQQFLFHLGRHIATLKRRFGAPMSVGIALPGSVSPLSGLIKNSNILPLNGQPLLRDLRRYLGQPVAIGNDGNCFALSEAVDGAGRRHDIVFGITLGTGCGGGLVIDKRLIAGHNGNAAECGHIPLPGYCASTDGAAARCYCGQQNCAESFISGTGFAQRYAMSTGTRAAAHEIITLAAAGEPAAARHFERYLDQLARVLAAICNLVDPGAIVLGGGLSNALAQRTDLESRVARYAFTDRFTTHIVPAMHGDSSGVRGAAWLGRDAPGD